MKPKKGFELHPNPKNSLIVRMKVISLHEYITIYCQTLQQPQNSPTNQAKELKIIQKVHKVKEKKTSWG